MEKDFNAYSPFPRNISLAKDIHKLALFSYPIHAYALYENGNLIKWGLQVWAKKFAYQNWTWIYQLEEKNCHKYL
jgi:hypothetical protein